MTSFGIGDYPMMHRINGYEEVKYPDTYIYPLGRVHAGAISILFCLHRH